MAAGVPVLILKEGATRTYGREALRSNILAARIIAEVLKTSLGPRGMDKMIVDAFGDITVTNDGVTILKEMDVQHPAAKLIVETAKAQDAEVGDGTTSVVVLAGSLLEKAEPLLDQNIHPSIIIEGYKKAMEKALEELSSIAIKINPKDKEYMRRLVSTTLSSKFVGQEAEEIKNKLLDMIIEAAYTVAVEQPDSTLRMSMDDIKIEKKKGGSLLDSQLVKGIVLDKEVVHPGMPKRVEKAKILVLDTPLEVEKPDITAKINITDPRQIEAFLEEQTKILKEMVDKIAEAGANVVITQKGIDDVAAHFLAKKGIMAIRRVKRSDIEKVAKATGARVVTSLKDVSPEVLGEAELVEERRVGKDKMVFIEGAKNPRAVTILLRGASDMALDEAERNIVDALHVLRNIFMKPMIVAGGGAVEVELAERLRKFAATVGGKEQLAIEAYAEALEEIPVVLADTAGMDTLETLMELRKLHREGKIWAGVNVVEGKVEEDMTKLGVVEPVRVREQVIKSATEAANALLKIDDVIAAAPPKETGKGKKGEGEEEEEGEKKGSFGGEF